MIDKHLSEIHFMERKSTTNFALCYTVQTINANVKQILVKKWDIIIGSCCEISRRCWPNSCNISKQRRARLLCTTRCTRMANPDSSPVVFLSRGKGRVAHEVGEQGMMGSLLLSLSPYPSHLPLPFSVPISPCALLVRCMKTTGDESDVANLLQYVGWRFEIAIRTRAQAPAQQCCTNVAKRVQHHATSKNVARKI